MSKSINKVILIGHAGKDPEVRYTANGTPVAKFSLATNEKFKDRNGEWQERTEWHTVIAWQRLAEIVGEYVKSGSRLYVEGKLQTSSWERNWSPYAISAMNRAVNVFNKHSSSKAQAERVRSADPIQAS